MHSLSCKGKDGTKIHVKIQEIGIKIIICLIFEKIDMIQLMLETQMILFNMRICVFSGSGTFRGPGSNPKAGF